MRCFKCGRENDNNARFCVNCGSRLNNMQQNWQGQQNVNTNNLQRNQQMQQNWQVQQNANINNLQRNQQMQQNWQVQQNVHTNNLQRNQQMQQNLNSNINNELPMKWHSFIVNVAYILAMILLFGNAARLFITAVVGDGGLYSLTGIRALNIIYALCNIVITVVIFFIRKELNELKKNSWKHLIIYMIVNNVLSIIYILALYLIINLYWEGFGFPVTADLSTSIAGGIVMIVCNYIYYKKREHLFIN